MTIPTALRLVGWLLTAIAAASAVLGTTVLLDGASSLGASGGFMGLVMSGAMQSFWQTMAGTAMALLCFAEARRLQRAP